MADDKAFTKEELDAEIEKAVAKATGDVEGLKEKVAELIASEKKWKAEARRASEIKPEDVAAIEAERDKALADLAASQKQAKDATAAADKATKALQAESAVTQKLLIHDGLSKALIEAGVKDADVLDVLTAKFAAGAKVVAEGDERKAFYGDKPLGDHIKEWAASDVGKKFVTAPANVGGGAQGGTRAKADASTMTRAEYDALDQVAKGEAGVKMAKGEIKIIDQAA